MNELTIHERDGSLVIEVDVHKAVYQGIMWESLSEYQKRKYENLIFIKNNRGLPIKFIYHDIETTK